MTEVWPASGPFEDYGPNFVAELVGIALTLAIVNEIVAGQRKRELAPQREAAGRRLRRVLRDMVTVIGYMYRATAPTGSPRPASVDDLLSSWKTHARELDGRAVVTAVWPRPDWATFMETRSEEFARALRDLTDRHAEALGIAIAAAVEEVLGDPVLEVFFRRAWILDTTIAAVPGRSPVLVGAPLDGLAESLARLCRACEALTGDPIPVSGYSQDDNPNEPWGDARVDRPDLDL